MKLKWKKSFSQDISFTVFPLRDFSEAGKERTILRKRATPGLNLVLETLRINL